MGLQEHQVTQKPERRKKDKKHKKDGLQEHSVTQKPERRKKDQKHKKDKKDKQKSKSRDKSNTNRPEQFYSQTPVSNYIEDTDFNINDYAEYMGDTNVTEV